MKTRSPCWCNCRFRPRAAAHPRQRAAGGRLFKTLCPTVRARRLEDPNPPGPAVNRLGDRALAAAILDRRPQVVGFTCYLWNIQRTIWIAQQLKAASPNSASCSAGRKSPTITAGCSKSRRSTWRPSARANRRSLIFIGAQAGRSTEGIPGLWNRGGGLPLPRSSLGRPRPISSPYIEGMLDAAEEQTMFMETSAAAVIGASSATIRRATTRSTACRSSRSRPTCDTPASGA